MTKESRPGNFKLSMEGTIGLLFEVVLGILDHLHVREPIIVWGLFLIGLALISDSIIRSKAARKRKLVGMAVVAFAFTSFGIWIFCRQQTKETSVPKQELDTPSPTHTLLVRYSESALPIRIAPGDTAYVLQLNPNITQWVWEVSNGKEKAISWPEDSSPRKGGPPGDPIYICTLTNDEAKTLLDVSVSFRISFHRLEIFPVTIKKNKDGTQSISMPAPGTDHIMVTLNRPGGETLAARDGVVAKQLDHSVSIPSLHPGQSAKIYLVNQSALISKFTFPSEATAIVAGDARRINISLVRPDVTVLDRLPWFGLGPSKYHWKGVPEAP